MANAVYPKALEGLLSGAINFGGAATVKASLVSGYTYSAAHTNVSDVTGAGGTLQATAALTSLTATLGVADAADITFTSVLTAPACALLIYQASAAAGGADVASSSQRLIAYVDTGTNLPVTPNGGNIAVAWDNGSNKLFAL